MVQIKLIVTVALLLQFSRAYHVSADNTCTTEVDCLSGWEYCKNSKCVHKEVWPLLPLEYVGLVVVFFVLMFTNAGGIGGGGTLLPVAIVFFRFDLKRAIALSNSTICVSAIVRYLMNSRKPHPLKETNGLLVDYNIGILILPSIFLGVVIGSAFQKMGSTLVLLAAYVCLMVGIVWMNCAKIF